MNRFLYFLRNAPGCDAAGLAALGLAGRFGAPGKLRFAVTAWPDGPGGSGCVIHAAGVAPRFDAQTQIWAECEQFCVGIERDFAPGPRDLERAATFNGYEVELLDGNRWRVPQLRRWDVARGEYVSTLPKALRPVVEDGRVTMKPVVRYQYEKLDAWASEIVAAYAAETQWELDKVCALASALLSENYRVGIEEIALLGLLDEERAKEILALSIDAPGLEAAAKALAAESGMTVSVTEEEVAHG